MLNPKLELSLSPDGKTMRATDGVGWSTAIDIHSGYPDTHAFVNACVRKLHYNTRKGDVPNAGAVTPNKLIQACILTGMRKLGRPATMEEVLIATDLDKNNPAWQQRVSEQVDALVADASLAVETVGNRKLYRLQIEVPRV